MALVLASSFLSPLNSQAQDVNGARPSTVLPTDVVPLALPQERRAIGESMKLRLWQKLPSRFYMNASCETSFRLETNVFQFPEKRKLLQSFTTNRGVFFGELSPEDQLSVLATADRSSQHDVVYRVSPNITAGWALTPRTNVFVNYFYLRDKLSRFNSLNTYINQIGTGIEHNIPVGKKGNLEVQFMTRELFQAEADPIFDYLPSATFSYLFKPGWVAYANLLTQFRSLQFFGGVDREIDPFYTVGLLHQRGRWSFSANGTYLTNYRKGFRDAAIQLNSQTIILDFEIARQLFKKVNGLQAFMRAEPVYNFGTDNTPGLAGMDFRLFWGLRGNVSKQPLLATIQQLKQRYKSTDPNLLQNMPQKTNSKNKKTNPKDPPIPPADGDGEKKDEQVPGAPSAMMEDQAPGAESANAPAITPASLSASDSDTPAIVETAAPMHGFITHTNKEVEDPSLAVKSSEESLIR